MTTERIAVYVLAAAVFIVFSLYRMEAADHEATRATLERARLENAVLRDSSAIAIKAIEALQKQLKAMADAQTRERDLAAKREAVLKGVKAVPAVDAGVVDMETSKRAVRHINETLRRTAAF